MEVHFELLDEPEESTLICTHDVAASEVLEELQPSFIILYDPEPAFVRAIELMQATSPSTVRFVYFLMQEVGAGVRMGHEHCDQGGGGVVPTGSACLSFPHALSLPAASRPHGPF